MENFILIEEESQIGLWAHWSGLKCLFFECLGNTLLSLKRTQQTCEHFPKREVRPSMFVQYAPVYTVQSYTADRTFKLADRPALANCPQCGPFILLLCIWPTSTRHTRQSPRGKESGNSKRRPRVSSPGPEFISGAVHPQRETCALATRVTSPVRALNAKSPQPGL